MEARDIKNIEELIDGVKLVAVAGFKIAADGKVSIEDLKHLVDVAKNYEVLVAAIDGIDQIPAEAKDLDVSELQIIGAKVLDLVQAVREARELTAEAV